VSEPKVLLVAVEVAPGASGGDRRREEGAALGRVVRHREGGAVPGLGRLCRRQGGALDLSCADGGRVGRCGVAREKRRWGWGSGADGREVRRIQAAWFGWGGFGSGLGAGSVVVGRWGKTRKNREEKKQARWIGHAAVLGYGIAYSIPEVLNRATIY